MFRAEIECPTTRSRVTVEIELKGNGAAGVPPYAGTVTCPGCGSEHEWNRLQILGLIPPPLPDKLAS